MRVERVENPDWNAIEGHPDAMVGHSRAWFAFLQETQKVEPVVLRLHDREQEGLFVGGIVRKFGLRILGSPFPGWTTSYLGILGPMKFLEALQAVREFAFRQLGVIHFECLDAKLTPAEIANSHINHRIFQNYLLDLTITPEELQSGLAKNAKGSLSTAKQRGVVVTLDPPDIEFARAYYDQLVIAFARQGLKPPYLQVRIDSLLRHLRPTQNVITGWSKDETGKVIATNISVGNQKRATLWGAAFNRDFARLQPTEMLQWEIIRKWQTRGTRAFDFGGAGEYKRKYGGLRIETPYVRFSRYPFLEYLRQRAFEFTRWRQRQSVSMPPDDIPSE